MALCSRAHLVRIRHVDLPVHEHLAVHGFDGCIRRFKRVKGYKAKALGHASVVVALDLGRGYHHAKRAKRVIQELHHVRM